MSSRRILTIFVLVAMALVGAIGVVARTSPDEVEHQRFSTLLVDDHALDDDTIRHALEARFGFAPNYDQLAADGREARRLVDESQHALPSFLSIGERRSIEQLFGRYRALSRERELLVERFKSENALLRNSLGYFPNAVDSALPGIGDPHLATAVATLRTLTLRLALQENQLLAEQQRVQIETVAKLADGSAAPAERHSVEVVSAHARAIANHKTKTEELLRALLQLPLDEARARIVARYASAHLRAERRASVFGLFVSGLSLVLLGTATYAGLRLRLAKAALSRANEHLELAVAERTAELEAEMARRARVEIELRQAQKLEAVGQLASGIAHEINTPIQYVGDSVYFLRQAFADVMRLVQAYGALLKQPELASRPELEAIRLMAEEVDVDMLKSEVPEAFDRTAEGTRQVASIVRAMKTFAHTSVEKAPMDLNAAIRNTLIVARNEYKYVADVETELGHIPDVTCNASSIRQVLLNLIVNAAHAIADAGASAEKHGAIRIATARRDTDVIVSIADTGGGIPEAIRERIFDPFFTTKEPGRGSGQGLAISRSIVNQHGGKLWFRTEPGRGTIFFVELPIQTGEQQKQAGSEYAA
ncbi:MAG TPA: DAHL domain-containing protein [Polyangiaceae bacterium]|nr:DAHL domain-containing protein [Polyangiaceae bacterium]